MIRARSQVTTLLKLTLVCACAAMAILWPTWRVALLAQSYYQELGRMTGGGNCTTAAGVKVTHGFELHCDASGSNNLEVNWQDQTGSHRFHLDELETAICPADSRDIEEQPVAGFNTFIGSGTGTFDGSTAAVATWVFSDQGEPGKDNDGLVITIVTPSGPVLSVVCTLDGGNHQAHPEQ